MSAELPADPHALARQMSAWDDDPAYVRLEGLHCVKHAVRFGADMMIMVTADRSAALELARTLAPDLLARLQADLVDVEPALLAELFGTSRFDVVGFAHRPAPDVISAAPGPAVLLEDPRNLGNLGAVVRVAAGFGARVVRTTGSVDPWHPTVVRAAAGLHFAVRVEQASREHAVPHARERPVLAFDPAGDDLRDVTVADDAVLAFGSERHGLSSAMRRRADRVVAIPMREHMSSYNLATSVAIALFHWSAGAGRGLERPRISKRLTRPRGTR